MVVAAMVLAVVGTGCQGCEAWLDGLEGRLQEDPTRKGKVGVWRGLEVAERARSVGMARAHQNDRRCHIGWQWEEAFEVAFEFEITAGDDGQRRWREEGTWHRDESGRWAIESAIAFRDGAKREGMRQRRVVATEDGFVELVGPERGMRSPVEGSAERWWRDEYGGRFEGLMALGSRGDEAVFDCGPGVGGEGVSGWRELWPQESQVTVEVERDEKAKEGRRCRQLKLEVDAAKGPLRARLRECVAPYDGEVELGELRLVELERERGRQRIQEALEIWSEEAWIETLEASDE